MDQFNHSRRQFREFPCNLVSSSWKKRNYNAYKEQLNERGSSLFCSESSSEVGLWDYDEQANEFREAVALNLEQLDFHLAEKTDPRARFFFICARHSRAPLNLTRDMLLLLLTHHQVDASFLDFVFTFGQRHYAQKSPFCGIRHHRRFPGNDLHSLQLPKLGRSGRELCLSYNLRGIEPSKGQTTWPWAIRQTVIYHTFDIITGRATWMIFKANSVIENRMKTELSSSPSLDRVTFNTISQAIVASLTAHIAVLGWSSEHWSCHIDFLEEEMMKILGRPSQIPAEVLYSPVAPCSPVSPISPKTAVFSPLSRAATFESCGAWSEKRLIQSPVTGREMPTTDRFSKSPPQVHPFVLPESEFKIDDLQKSQRLGENIAEVIQVFKTNVTVIESLANFYKESFETEECPAELKHSCKAELQSFLRQASGVADELRGQQLRAESLLRTLNERRILLFGIIEYQNLQANRLLAEEANRSATSMANITMHMHDIAKKTKEETVSMRIITLVTLFFLPATFMSTFMTTDVVRWQPLNEEPVQRVFSLGALSFYLMCTLPLMAITFLGSYLVYRYVKRREDFESRPLDSLA